MKQFAFILTLSLLSVFSLQAQSTPAKSDDGAKITFDKEVVDYGTIKQGADPLRTFKFKNTGAGPLVITSATGSCGCTVPTYPQEPILPGASAEIKVKYDTQRKEVGYGISYHPSAKTNKNMANQLTEEIKKIMKW